MPLNVHQASKETGLSEHTIRYYTNLDIIPDLKHDENGNRVFERDDLNWLNCTKALRESGLSIKQVKHYFKLCQRGDSTIKERFEILQELLRQSEEELEKQKARVECIRDKVEHCRMILKGEIPDDCNPIYWA